MPDDVLPHWQLRTGTAVAVGVAGVVLARLGGAAPHGAVTDVVFLLSALIGAAAAWTSPRRASWLVGASFVILACPLLQTLSVRTVGAVFFMCAVVGTAIHDRSIPSTLSRPTAARGHLRGALVVASVSIGIYVLFSVERHRRFGSGSWDYGCYVHNAWLFAHGDAFSLSARSSVLGDVAWWGGTNHFMPSLLFTAPLAWLMEWTRDTSWLAVAQCAVVVAAVFPLALLARRRGLTPLVSTVLVVAFVLHIGTQSALLFDVHEIAPVPLLMFTALLIVDDAPSRRRLAWLVALLLVWAGTKESSWLGVASFGLFLGVLQPRWRRVGVGVFIVAVLGFIVVVGIIQPSFLEEGSRGMIHAARFRGVGEMPAESLGEALRSILFHPGRTIASLITPTEKLATLLSSTAGYGHLPLLSPAGWLLGGANLAERFLSDKREMWGLAFHYGLVTASWLAVGALDVATRFRHRPRVVSAVLLAGMLSSFLTASRAPDLLHLEQPYFADGPTVERFSRALTFIHDDDAVVAQNHFLPHLALRRQIWLPEERFIERADVVMLDTTASPWPNDSRYIRRLVERLRRDARFEPVFDEATTIVFRRRARTTKADHQG